MRLGWIDKCYKGKVYELKKHRQESLFDRESTAAYCTRFFDEVKGLGNAYLCIVKGKNYVRIIGERSL
jgi:hypothetical protein